jgi:hypothetical protein
LAPSDIWRQINSFLRRGRAVGVALRRVPSFSCSADAPSSQRSSVSDLVGSLTRAARPRSTAAMRRALIVGGDALHQRFCETFLRTLNVAVVLAPSCREGLRAIGEAGFDIVIVDEDAAEREHACWACLDLLVRMNRGQLYVVSEARGLRGLVGGEATAARPMPKPVRAISLVEALARLPR